jgi:hypothetical protein
VIARWATPRTLGLIAAAMAAIAAPRPSSGFGGTPPPPAEFCARGYAFAPAVPSSPVCVGGVVELELVTFHLLSLPGGACPTGGATVELASTLACDAGPGAGPVVIGPFALGVGPGFRSDRLVLPCVAGDACVLTVTATVELADGTTLWREVALPIDVVAPAAGGAPALEVRAIDPGGPIVGTHPGDQHCALMVVTNHDPSRTWTGALEAAFVATSGLPSEVSADPVRTAFALGDPGPGSRWPMAFGDDLAPGASIPLPGLPPDEIESRLDGPAFTLAPGASVEVSLHARPWGLCGEGACGVATLRAIGAFDGGGGGAAAGASTARWVDALHRPAYRLADAGAAARVSPDPGGGPGDLAVRVRPTADAADAAEIRVSIDPTLVLVDGAPASPTIARDAAQDLGPFAGRSTITLTPTGAAWGGDAGFELELAVIAQERGGPLDAFIAGAEAISAGTLGLGQAPLWRLAVELSEDPGGGTQVVETLVDLSWQISGYAITGAGGWRPLEVAGAFAASGAPGAGLRLSCAAAGGVAGETIAELRLFHDVRGFARPAPAPVCPGDVTGDGRTDVFDFAELAEAFGSSIGDPGFNPGADLNSDGAVDVFDFAELAEDFGCEPGA